MNEEELNEIEARVKAASDGPWTWNGNCMEGPYTLKQSGIVIQQDVLSVRLEVSGYEGYDVELDIEDADRDFIAAARQDVPKLLAEVRILREVIDGMAAWAFIPAHRTKQEAENEANRIKAMEARLQAAEAVCDYFSRHSCTLPREIHAQELLAAWCKTKGEGK